MRIVSAALAVLLLALPSNGIAQRALQADTTVRWTLVAVGDVIMNRRIMQHDHPADTAFSRMANIIRSADVAFMNFEQSAFPIDDPRIWPAAETGGGYTRTAPEIVPDLVELGFDLANRANNHTTDWGVAGMRATDSLLTRLGIVHAGTGENLGLASRPGYLETPKGRVALLGMASTFTTMSPAGLASGSVRGRPGINPLRVHHVNYVTPETMEGIRTAARDLGLDPRGDTVHAYFTDFLLSDTNRVWDSLDVADRTRVISEVRNAANQASYVVVNSHSHDPVNIVETPPEWIQRFARDVIDAGATAFLIEGPHQLRGIEIHNGRPIFYSLGNFIFQIETIDPLPADVMAASGLPLGALVSEVYNVQSAVDSAGNATRGFAAQERWWRSVVAHMTFSGQEVVEIHLYPIDLARTSPRADRGTPRLASDDVAREIIEHLAELSEPFGTRIVFENGVGIWRR